MALTMTAAALAGCSSSSSAPATTAAPKTEAGSEASGDTQAAGSEEKKGGGKLVVYSPNSEGLMNATIPLFEEKYGVDVEVIQAGTGELVKRIQSEKNDPYADVLFGGSWSLGTIRISQRRRCAGCL